MSIERKREAALRRLAETGIWRSNYNPPALRLLWSLGIDVPPPHFARFGATALLAGAWFAIAWGLLMWLLVWTPQRMPWVVAAITALVAGALFGVAMAGYYAWGRRKHGLPLWKDFDPDP
ncbi:DUF6404 family protein [Luteimonas salinilitoris]|uniref:DUF6404 family protein n=1 Tax=Luteimonas salinilitoris TaxID=3237697 RepID=A0ABV4HKI2_9GAMM